MKMRSRLVAVVVSLLVAFPAIAGAQEGTSILGVRRSITTIMFAGLAGAVLGLSTLSFYGEPQDHVGNIWTGLAVGALAGTGYVLAKTTSQNTAFEELKFKPKMNPGQRPLLVYNFDF